MQFELLSRLVTSMQATTGHSTPYKELKDEEVFQQLVGEHMVGLWELEACEMVDEMYEKYKRIDWDALVHSCHT